MNPKYNSAIKYGFILATITIVVKLAMYLANMNSTSVWISVLLFLFSLGFIYYVGLEERKAHGGYISWKDVLVALFICTMIGFISPVLFDQLFNTFIDPSKFEEEKKIGLEMIEKLRNHVGDEAADAQIEKLLAQKSFSFSGLVMLILGGIIISFIISSVIALFIKKENPNAIFEKYNKSL
ncbi:MAG TPA: DUF4199 domain-containing protein [Saprospiraceae bacterium]|nr:DUF4199 domain-containing protein [Saprospiraceae bacterium]